MTIGFSASSSPYVPKSRAPSGHRSQFQPTSMMTTMSVVGCLLSSSVPFSSVSSSDMMRVCRRSRCVPSSTTDIRQTGRLYPHTTCDIDVFSHCGDDDDVCDMLLLDFEIDSGWGLGMNVTTRADAGMTRHECGKAIAFRRAHQVGVE